MRRITTLGFLCCAAIAASSSSSSITVAAQQQQQQYRTCGSPIYCPGPLLETVQLAQLYPDSKTFVDKPTSKPLDQVLSAFNALGQNASRDDIQKFVDDNFLKEGSEMKPVNLSISADLPLLDKIDDLTYRGWALQIHKYWANLTFEFDTSALCDGCVSSTLPVTKPFVVPGGRFREFYYWDSYFVIRGLLLSELNEQAKDMIDNFLEFVELYGFVPNGARIYYLNRSQPPFLVEMIKAYYNATGDDDYVKQALPTLDKEYEYWMKNKTVTVDCAGHNNKKKSYTLNQYRVINDAPRPESYLEDYETAYVNVSLSDKQVDQLFANLATGAESGWDYSSRWTRYKDPLPDDPSAYHLLRSLNNYEIVPVDLNALLWSMETTLAEWHAKFDGSRGSRKAKYYKRQAAKRLEAFENVFWDDETYAFYDYNLTSQSRNVEYTPAGLYPIWLGALPNRIKRNQEILSHLMDETRNALEKYPGILTTSYDNTTLQWDLPNGWPPLQYIALNAMMNVNNLLKEHRAKTTSLLDTAHVLAERYLASAFCSWYKTGGYIPGVLQQLPNQTDVGHMFEKFDVEDIGDAGGGGEYTVQAGFGWTNGVVLWVFDTFGGFTAPDCNQPVTYSL